MTVEFSLLLGVALVLSLGLLARMGVRAASRFAVIRQELESCPQMRELRFTIRETVVRYNDGKIIALPVRQPRLVRPAPQPLRAAA